MHQLDSSSDMTERRLGYLSYLLRVWRTGGAGDAVWRASLEDPLTGERQGFASLKDLLAFLQMQTEGEVQVEMNRVEQNLSLDTRIEEEKQ